MREHPGEALKGFGKSMLLLDTPEVFSGITKNLTELFDSDANGWARAAGATEAASKLSGWLAAVAGIVAAVLIAIAFATGVGEIAAGVIAIGVALAALAMGLAGVSSILRAKAASKAKTKAEFDRHVDAGSSDLAGGIVGIVAIVTALVVHATAKAVFPKQLANLRTFLDNLGNRIRAGLSKARGSTKPGAGASGTSASPPGTTPEAVPEPIQQEPDTAPIRSGEPPPGEVVGDYQILGEKGLKGKTFVRRIPGIRRIRPPSGERFKPLFESFIAEAKRAGATKLQVTIEAIGNPKIYRNVGEIQQWIESLGGKVTTEPGTVTIIIPL